MAKQIGQCCCMAFSIACIAEPNPGTEVHAERQHGPTACHPFGPSRQHYVPADEERERSQQGETGTSSERSDCMEVYHRQVSWHWQCSWIWNANQKTGTTLAAQPPPWPHSCYLLGAAPSLLWAPWFIKDSRMARSCQQQGLIAISDFSTSKTLFPCS